MGTVAKARQGSDGRFSVTPLQDGGFSVTPLQPPDVKAFIRLQDLFATEHLCLTRTIYDKVDLRDWQLSLLCPEKILERPGGREDHVLSMISRVEECFQTLHILKATHASRAGEAPMMAGYIMFQTHAAAKRRRKKRGPRNAAPSGAFVQVKQIFVNAAFRNQGCGQLLFSSMLKAIEDEELEDIRLSVLDLNLRATRWYRSQGFVVVGISREFIGDREQANVVVYQEMRRTSGSREEEMRAIPSLFRLEIQNEVLTIKYPDKSGTFVVKVRGFDAAQKWHFVDSAGLSQWEGDSFVDTVNLNEYFRDGYVTFQRHLSQIFRDVELARREERRAKVAAKAALHELRTEPSQAELVVPRAKRLKLADGPYPGLAGGSPRVNGHGRSSASVSSPTPPSPGLELLH